VVKLKLTDDRDTPEPCPVCGYLTYWNSHFRRKVCGLCGYGAAWGLLYPDGVSVAEVI
jgi:ribosomal protein S27AE